MKYKRDGMFAEILDNILTFGSLGKASAASNVDPWTISRWRRLSEDGHGDFQAVDYRGVIQPFHLHVEDAIEGSIDEIESNFRASARDGYYVPALWHGEFCYERDDEVVAMDQATRDMLGITDDFKWVTNPSTGCKQRQKIMVWIPPSVDAQVKVLSSWSERYSDKRSLKVDMNVTTLGVTVLRDGPPYQVAAAPTVQLEIIEPQPATVPDAPREIAAVDVEISDQCSFHQVGLPVHDLAAGSSLSQEQREILKRLRSQSPLVQDLAKKAEANLSRRMATNAGAPLAVKGKA
jgi:hypothetical protein